MPLMWTSNMREVAAAATVATLIDWEEHEAYDDVMLLAAFNWVLESHPIDGYKYTGVPRTFVPQWLEQRVNLILAAPKQPSQEIEVYKKPPTFVEVAVQSPPQVIHVPVPMFLPNPLPPRDDIGVLIDHIAALEQRLAASDAQHATIVEKLLSVLEVNNAEIGRLSEVIINKRNKTEQKLLQRQERLTAAVEVFKTSPPTIPQVSPPLRFLIAGKLYPDKKKEFEDAIFNKSLNIVVDYIDEHTNLAKVPVFDHVLAMAWMNTRTKTRLNNMFKDRVIEATSLPMALETIVKLTRRQLLSR